MKIRDIVKEYNNIYKAHRSKSIEKLWNELEICQQNVFNGIVSGHDISDILKESLVISDLIKQKSEKCRKRFLKKLRDMAWNSETDEEFGYRLRAMNFFGEEYIIKLHKTY